MKKSIAMLWVSAVCCMAAVLVGCKHAAQADEMSVINRVSAIYDDVAARYNANPPATVASQLDSLYCSKDWNETVSAILEKDAKTEGVGFFEADHWVMGQDFQNVSANSIVVESQEGDTISATLNLHNCGTTTHVRLSMVEENGEWRIDNFTDTDNQFDWKQSMRTYLGTEQLLFDSLSYEKEDTTAEVKINVQYPVSGPAVLVDSLRKYIASELRVERIWNGNKDSLLLMAAQKGYDEMKKERDESFADGMPEVPPYYYAFFISKIAETDRYLTMSSRYEEFRGGAHGGVLGTASTFRKSDGKKMGWNMLTKTKTPEFHRLMINGLRSYFDVEGGEKITTDEQLKNCLIIEGSIDELPLPQFDPYLMPEGVLFVYQQYEIAAYAVGMPAFVVSYKDIMPYLTDEAKELIK